MTDSAVLERLPGRYAVCRRDPGDPVPDWCRLCGASEPLLSVTRTERELSILAPERTVPPEETAERGFVALAVVGPLDFALVGLLARLTGAMAAAGIPVLAISTHDTDVLLVRQERAAEAEAALQAAGYRIR